MPPQVATKGNIPKPLAADSVHVNLRIVGKPETGILNCASRAPLLNPGLVLEIRTRFGLAAVFQTRNGNLR